VGNNILNSKNNNSLEEGIMIKDTRIKQVREIPKEGTWLPIPSAMEKLGLSYNSLYQKVRLGSIGAINWQGVTLINIITTEKNNEKN
jgi:hypothetical protein